MILNASANAEQVLDAQAGFKRGWRTADMLCSQMDAFNAWGYQDAPPGNAGRPRASDEAPKTALAGEQH